MRREAAAKVYDSICSETCCYYGPIHKTAGWEAVTKQAEEYPLMERRGYCALKHLLVHWNQNACISYVPVEGAKSGTVDFSLMRCLREESSNEAR